MPRYLTNLEFLWDQGSYGPDLQTRRNYWTLASYLLLCLGLFSRQITDFPTVNMRPQNERIETLLASFLIGLAIFPPIMRFLNKYVKKPSWEQVAMSYSVGFFVNLSTAKLLFGPMWQKFFQ